MLSRIKAIIASASKKDLESPEFKDIVKEVDWRKDCEVDHRNMFQTPWTVVVKDQKRLVEHKWPPSHY